MKQLSSKRKFTLAESILAIIINTALFMLDIPCDLGDWIFKTIELFVFFKILNTSWESRFSPMFRSHFQKLNKASIFLNLKNK